MVAFSQEDVVEGLQAIVHPKHLKDIIALEYVQHISLKDGHLRIMVEAAEADLKTFPDMEKCILQKMEILEKGLKVSVLLTSQKAPAPAAADGPRDKIVLSGVKHIIAVASGKGGVGKSTTTVNVAYALAAQGFKVGVMDADIYGPSIPTLFGMSGKPGATADKKIIPFEKDGIVFMSIGFMIPDNAPVIWRGPMVMGAVQQLLKDVDWGVLDVLMIDMPPGTGDAHLTLAQKIDMHGVIIVTTPQDLALIDARKGLEMFQKMKVPVLGLIENMSVFVCPNCNHESAIFGHGTVEAEARNYGVPYLGAIPLDPALRASSDKGEKSTDCALNEHYAKIALKLRIG